MYKKRKLLFFITLVSFIFLCSCSKKSNNEPQNSTQETSAEALSQSTSDVPDSYSAIVYVTINPEIALYLDEDGVVICAAFLNQDAEDIYQGVNFTNLSLDQAVNTAVTVASDQGYLTGGKTVTLDVEVNEYSNLSADDIIEKAQTTVHEYLDEKQIEAEVVAHNITNENPSTQGTPSENLTINDDTNHTDNTTEDSYADNTHEGNSPVEQDGDNSENANSNSLEDTNSNDEQNSGIEICPHCNGTGVCSQCNGTKELVCDACQGINSTYTCPYCNGTTMATCSACNGVGGCAACHTTGTQPCNKCNGTGNNCWWCNNTGIMECTTCHGHSICEICHGTGLDYCGPCIRTGVMHCYGCGGTGMMPCNGCDGTGICNECHGTGYRSTPNPNN